MRGKAIRDTMMTERRVCQFRNPVSGANGTTIFILAHNPRVQASNMTPG
jgi:hypothetical protein